MMKDEIISRQFGQQDPVLAYKKEGFDLFDKMIDRIRENTVKVLINTKIEAKPREPEQQTYQVVVTGKELTPEERAKKEAEKKKPFVQKTVVNDKPKLSRNDLCYCGSGKKYKNCCWDKDHQ